MKGESLPQAARIFSEMLDSLQLRVNFQNKLFRLEGCSVEHLKGVLRSIHFEKERQASRIRCEDDLMNEIARYGSLDKQLKQHMTHFSFEAVELLQPQLTFRLERHYVNIGKLFAAYFQSIESREHCEKLVAAFGTASSAFKLEYYVGLLRLFFEHIRARFNKAVKDASASILAQLKTDQECQNNSRSPNTEAKEDPRSLLSIMAPNGQYQAYTGRSRSRRKKPRQNGLFSSAAKRGLEQLELKLSEINEAFEGRTSNRYEAPYSLRLDTYFDPIFVEGNSKNMQRADCSHPRTRRSVDRKLKCENDSSLVEHSPVITSRVAAVDLQPMIESKREKTEAEYITDIPSKTALLPEKPEKKTRTLRRNNVSEEHRKNLSVFVGTQRKLPPLCQPPECVPKPDPLDLQPKKYVKNLLISRRYDQFIELYGGNMLGAAADALADIDTDYHRDRRKRLGIDRDAWIEEHMESVVLALLAENREASNAISRFVTECSSLQTVKEASSSIASVLTKRAERPTCKTLLTNGPNASISKEWRR